jgi:hypothetical protein
MIPPRQQWAAQIEITNQCPRACANCTRSLAHQTDHWFLPVADFARALTALADFVTESPPDLKGRPKVVGLIGGEPLLHPRFETLCRVFCELVPDRRARGLWTGLPLERHKHRQIIADTFGYLNHNTHHPDKPSYHQPVLVGVGEVVRDEARMYELINACWLQEEWASTITPKGFFFCEVAGSLDAIFHGPGGLPVRPGCWAHDLAEYRHQIERWCPRCSVCLPLPPRRDSEEIDDLSPGNLRLLRAHGSPRVAAGAYQQFNPADYQEAQHRDDWAPHRYLK